MSKKKKGWGLYILWVIISYMLGRAVAKKIDKEYHIFTPETPKLDFSHKNNPFFNMAVGEDVTVKGDILDLEKEPADAEADESDKLGFFSEGAVDHQHFFKEALRRQKVVNDIISEQAEEEGEC